MSMEWKVIYNDRVDGSAREMIESSELAAKRTCRQLLEGGVGMFQIIGPYGSRIGLALNIDTIDWIDYE